MAEMHEEKRRLHQNLKDAGCDEKTIAELLELSGDNKNGELKKALTKHRKCLLQSLHENQAKIDCLDFLLYSMDKDSNLA